MCTHLAPAARANLPRPNLVRRQDRAGDHSYAVGERAPGRQAQELDRDQRPVDAGKGCGRKSLAELSPEAVALARKLSRYPVNGHMRSLREIAVELEAAGHITRAGTRYAPAAIARMVGV
jgi:hypothetical protein